MLIHSRAPTDRRRTQCRKSCYQELGELQFSLYRFRLTLVKSHSQNAWRMLCSDGMLDLLCICKVTGETMVLH